VLAVLEHSLLLNKAHIKKVYTGDCVALEVEETNKMSLMNMDLYQMA
jgi:hypothetical protein